MKSIVDKRKYIFQVIFLLMILFASLAFAGESADYQILEEVNFPPGIPTDNMLDDMILAYRLSAQSWSEPLVKAADKLFYYLLVIDFTYSMILLVLADSDIQQYLVEIVKRILIVGFFLALLKFGSYWANAIVGSFHQLGNNATSGEDANASDIFESGIQVTSKIMKDARWLTGEIFLVSLIAIIVIGCFSVVAGIMVVTTVEMYLVLSAAVILLGFGGSRWTNDYAKKLFKICFSNRT